MTVDLNTARELLTAERAKLVQQLADLGADENGDLRRDLDFGEGFADAAAITAERTEVIGLVESIKGQLDGVVEALSRVEDGSYGVCQRCGETIAAARLEARPASVSCVSCKSRT
jgi:RNA polymerase-binding transcription factor DksA